MRAKLDGMKLFVGFLILLNFIYFLWPKDKTQPRPTYTRSDASTPMLRQLNEQSAPPPPESLVSEGYNPLAKKKPTAHIVNASFSELEVDATPAMILQPSTEPAQETVDHVSQDTLTQEESETINNTTTVTKPETATFESEPVDTQTPLETKPENKAKAETKDDIENSTEATPEADPQEQAPAPPHCITLGPFMKKQNTKTTLTDLNAMGLPSEIRSANQTQNQRFWVYLPAYPSRQEAIDKAEKLASQDVSDYFIISDGRRDNAISLGIYNNKSDANQRVKEIRTLGYNPKVDALRDRMRVFWIDIRTNKTVDWQRYLDDHFSKGNIKVLQRSCD
jgi:cell division septation protein DedD